jgi:hypothetical protein
MSDPPAKPWRPRARDVSFLAMSLPGKSKPIRVEPLRPSRSPSAPPRPRKQPAPTPTPPREPART